MSKKEKTALSEAVSRNAGNTSELTTMVLNVGCEDDQVFVVGTEKAIQAFKDDEKRDCDTINRDATIIEGFSGVCGNVCDFVHLACERDPAILMKACRFTNGDLAIAHVKDLLIDMCGSLDAVPIVKKAVYELENYSVMQSYCDNSPDCPVKISDYLQSCVNTCVRLVAHLQSYGSRSDWIDTGLLEYTYYSACEACTSVEALDTFKPAVLIEQYRQEAMKELAEEAEKTAIDKEYHDTRAHALSGHETEDIERRLIHLRKLWQKVKHDRAYKTRMTSLCSQFMDYKIKGKVHNAMCMWAFCFADLFVDAGVEGVAEGKIPAPLFNAVVDVLCERFHIPAYKCSRRLDDAIKDLTGHEWDD